MQIKLLVLNIDIDIDIYIKIEIPFYYSFQEFLCSSYFLFVKIILSTSFPEAKITTIHPTGNRFIFLSTSLAQRETQFRVGIDLQSTNLLPSMITISLYEPQI